MNEVYKLFEKFMVDKNNVFDCVLFYKELIDSDLTDGTQTYIEKMTKIGEKRLAQAVLIYIKKGE